MDAEHETFVLTILTNPNTFKKIITEDKALSNMISEMIKEKLKKNN